MTSVSAYGQQLYIEAEAYKKTSAAEEQQKNTAKADAGKQPDSDTVSISKEAKSAAFLREQRDTQLAKLRYETVETFTGKNGSTVSVAESVGDEDGGPATRVTVTSPDGAEEVLYFDHDGAAETGESSETDSSADSQSGMLQQFMKKINGGILDIRKVIFTMMADRNEAMLEAAKKSKEIQEALDALKEKNTVDQEPAAASPAADAHPGMDEKPASAAAGVLATAAVPESEHPGESLAAPSTLDKPASEPKSSDAEQTGMSKKAPQAYSRAETGHAQITRVYSREV